MVSNFLSFIQIFILYTIFKFYPNFKILFLHFLKIFIQIFIKSLKLYKLHLKNNFVKIFK